MPRRYLIHLSYFGTRYRGLQKQNLGGKTSYDDPLTICGLLEIALKGCNPVNHPIVIPSSRTDKGVHALCNTVHVDLDFGNSYVSSIQIHKQLNRFFTYNDHDIRILKTQLVTNNFHCRYHAYERRYLYRLAVPRPSIPFRERLIIPSPVTEFNRCYFLTDSSFDTEAVKSACNIFLGVKDFASFSSNSHEDRSMKKKVTIRDIRHFELIPGAPLLPSIELSKEYDFWQFVCTGKSFLYHQVRRMVSAIIQCGQGRIKLADIQQLIDEPIENGPKDILKLVPAHGLYLTNVLYHPGDLVGPENLSEEELRLKELEREEEQIIEALRTFKGTILQKIDLKKRLLYIKKATAASCDSN